MTKEIFFEEITSIKKTHNYDIFKTMTGNRYLNQKNYRKLIKSMTEEQLIIPILVNEKYEIVDGQHRFNVCKELNKPVYFYIVPGYNINHVKKANLVSCNWTLYDYIHLYCKLDKEQYRLFYSIIRENKFKPLQLLEICRHVEKRNITKLRADFEEGNFKFNNFLAVDRFIQDLQYLKFFKYYNYPKFTKAFIKLYVNENFSMEIFKKRIKTNQHRFSKQLSVNTYISMLVNDVYSLGITKNTLKYDMINDVFYMI